MVLALQYHQQPRSAWFSCTHVDDRIIVATFQTAITPLTVVQVYAPTHAASPQVQDAFYAQLQHQLEQIPKANMLLLIGDFNAKVGCQAAQWGGLHRQTWPPSSSH